MMLISSGLSGMECRMVQAWKEGSTLRSVVDRMTAQYAVDRETVRSLWRDLHRRYGTKGTASTK